jgi:mRNA interferase RelE/StbE
VSPQRKRQTRASRPSPATPVRRAGRHRQAERVVVRLTDPAFEDLRALLRLDPQIVRWALKKMLLLERDPEAGEILHGDLIGFHKLVVGDRDWRIVWRVTHDTTTVVVDVAEVWAVGARNDAAVYTEMRTRVALLPRNEPTTVALSEVVERLGDIATGIQPAHEPAPEPELPDWLIQRLRHQVGLTPGQITSLTLEQAVDTWTQWSTKPH